MTHVLKTVVAFEAQSITLHEAKETETILNGDNDHVLGFSKVGAIDSVGGSVSSNERAAVDLREAGAISEGDRERSAKRLLPRREREAWKSLWPQ